MKINKTEVESVQLGNTYIANMDKCPQDKCCKDKSCGDSFNLLYIVPRTLCLKFFYRIGERLPHFLYFKKAKKIDNIDNNRYEGILLYTMHLNFSVALYLF